MRLRAALSALLLLPLAGCGYHVAGSATHIPANIRTLAVPVFKNNTQSYRTESVFTQAVIHEMNTRTKYRITPADNSANTDATLYGTILKEEIAPLTYDSSSGQTSSYLITITSKVSLVGSDGKELYSNSKFTFRQQYQSTQDLSAFVQEDAPAVQRMARDFAQALVSDMLESF